MGGAFISHLISVTYCISAVILRGLWFFRLSYKELVTVCECHFDIFFSLCMCNICHKCCFTCGSHEWFSWIFILGEIIMWSLVDNVLNIFHFFYSFVVYWGMQKHCHLECRITTLHFHYSLRSSTPSRIKSLKQESSFYLYIYPLYLNPFKRILQISPSIISENAVYKNAICLPK